ncbi:DNA-directed DNA polymerase [Powellomyces hirtus]|uniref:Probable DNA polymerase n=1 Tax=Powellomyces hirtus TaxID=109895 RepID=A0A507DQ98_9FUNG|nr:DNA-directed DNA polymerase [Powellomyces hirtus]
MENLQAKNRQSAQKRLATLGAEKIKTIAAKAAETRKRNQAEKDASHQKAVEALRHKREVAADKCKKTREAKLKETFKDLAKSLTSISNVTLKTINYNKETYRFNPKHAITNPRGVRELFKVLIADATKDLLEGNRVQITIIHQNLFCGYWSSGVMPINALTTDAILDNIASFLQSSAVIDSSMTFEVQHYISPKGGAFKNYFDYTSATAKKAIIVVKNKDFYKYIFETPNTTFIAHNGRGYDFHFLYKAFNDNGQNPKYITVGRKIISMEIPKFNICFIDSMSFLPMGLSQLPKMFGIQQHVCKGHFPHWFKGGMGYVGPLPDLEDYGFDAYPVDKRGKYVFDYKKELVEYCKNDVNILAASIKLFKELLLLATDGNVDPWAYPTIASACMSTYRCMFMPEESIPTVHTKGVRRNSEKSIRWLEYLQSTQYPDLQHALRGGEKWIKRDGGREFFVDGFSSATNTVFEFNGCEFHGCDVCKDPKATNHKGVTYKTLQK